MGMGRNRETQGRVLLREAFMEYAPEQASYHTIAHIRHPLCLICGADVG